MIDLGCEVGIKDYLEFWFWNKEVLFWIFFVDFFGLKWVGSKI